MDKTKYQIFASKINIILLEYIKQYNIVANVLFPIKENDDIQYTLTTKEFGRINVLIESFNNIPKNIKDNNLFQILLYFENKDEKINKTFNFQYGNINDGTLILFGKENEIDNVLKDFKQLLNIISQSEKEIDILDFNYIQLN